MQDPCYSGTEGSAETGRRSRGAVDHAQDQHGRSGIGQENGVAGVSKHLSDDSPHQTKADGGKAEVVGKENGIWNHEIEKWPRDDDEAKGFEVPESSHNDGEEEDLSYHGGHALKRDHETDRLARQFEAAQKFEGE